MERAMVITVVKNTVPRPGVSIRASVSDYVDGVPSGLAKSLFKLDAPDITADVEDDELRCWFHGIVLSLVETAERMGCMHGPLGFSETAARRLESEAFRGLHG